MNDSSRIYVDLDDVLCETARAFLPLLEEHYDKTVAFEEITSFDLGVSFELTPDELAHFMHLVHRPEVLGALKPMAGALDALDAFIGMGYEIVIVTGRPPDSAEASRAWLNRHAIPYHSLIFVDKYQRDGARSATSPAPITLDELANLQFSYAIEDSSAMAAFLAGQMGLPVGLLDRPWNQEIRLDDPREQALVVRCSGWADAVGTFRQRRSGA